jgi:hypothetical protein
MNMKKWMVCGLRIAKCNVFQIFKLNGFKIRHMCAYFMVWQSHIGIHTQKSLNQSNELKIHKTIFYAM